MGRIRSGGRWWLASGLAVVLVCTTAGWWVADRYLDARQSEVWRVQSQLAQRHLETLDGGIQDSLAVLSGVPLTVAESESVRRVLRRFGPQAEPSALPAAERQQRWEGDAALRALQPQLQSLARALAADAIWLLNAAGDCVAASNAGTPGSFVGASYADRPYFTEAAAGRPGSQYAVGRTSRVPGLYFSAPVIEDGRFLGAVIAKRDVTDFSRWTRKADAFITDAQGVIVLASDPALAFHRLYGPVPDEVLARDYRRSTLPPLALAAWSPRRFPDLLLRPGDPTPQLLVHARPARGFTVHLLHPMDELRRLERERLPLAALLAGLANLLALAVALTVWRLRTLRREHTRAVAGQRELEALVVQRTAQLAAAQEAAEAATRARTEFLATMSHEIRTPLNAVAGLTHLLLRTRLDPRQLDQVRKIQTASRHLLGVVHDILDVSRIDAGELETDQVEFELNQVLEDVGMLLADKAGPKGLELVIDVAADVPERLIGDPLRLGQVLIHFVGNAVKYTVQGTVAMRVTLLARDRDRADLRFEVQDTGIGIAPAEQAPPGAGAGRQGGAGLGLTIARRLVGRMGGTVGVVSAPGAGSTFWFTARLGVGLTDAPRLLLRPDLCAHRLLVVEDNPTSREAIVAMLRRIGCPVTVADDAESALSASAAAVAARQPFDLVLLDAHLPGPDGLGLARSLRADGLVTGPLLLMAGHGEADEWHRAALQAGVDIAEVLLKPLSSSTLFDALMRQFGVRLSGLASGPVAPAAAPLDRPLAGRRALVAEDHELNQEVARELLNELGLSVDVVANGAAAVEQVQRARYDVVLMDVEMPVMDGLDATRAIRRLPALAGLPILAMTANAMPGDRERCLEAGMVDHIAKPIDPAVLRERLLHWTGPGPAAPPT